MGLSGKWSPQRRNEIRRACLSMSVGRFVRMLDKTLSVHKDKGGTVEQEAKAVFREAVMHLAEDLMGDSAVFLIDDTPHDDFQTKEWTVGHHTPGGGYDLEALKEELKALETPGPDEVETDPCEEQGT